MEAHLHHQAPHVVELLWVEEGGELLPGGDAVVVAVRLLEAALVSGQHGAVGRLLLHVLKLLAWGEESGGRSQGCYHGDAEAEPGSSEFYISGFSAQHEINGKYLAEAERGDEW